MSPWEKFFSALVALFAGGAGTFLFQVLTRKANVSKLDAEAAKLTAERGKIESESFSQPFRDALSFIVEMKSERIEMRAQIDRMEQQIEDLRAEVDTQRDLLESYEILMRKQGIDVPGR